MVLFTMPPPRVFVVALLVIVVATAEYRVARASPQASGAAETSSQMHPAVYTVAHGVLQPGGVVVGNFTSQLQAAVVNNSQLFAAVSPADWANISVVTPSTALRTLILQGQYFVDEPLRLPSLFVLQLTGASLQPAANLSVANVSRFTGLVTLEKTTYSAVVGGVVDATGLAPPEAGSGYMAVAVLGGSHNAVRGVRALANNSGAAIGVNGSPHTEVAWCDVGGPRGSQTPLSAAAMTNGRCIWTLATQHAYVHDNEVAWCSMHALDFDAYTGSSAAFNNYCHDNGEEGIFVEETAHGNVVFNNTCVRNKGSGIALYSNAVGPVTNNFIIGNDVRDNGGAGLSDGAYGHAADKVSIANVFIGNTASGNAYAWNPQHGAVDGSVWTANVAQRGQPEWPAQGPPHNSSAVSFFQPSEPGREAAGAAA